MVLSSTVTGSVEKFSKAYELKSDDTIVSLQLYSYINLKYISHSKQEFGIDISGEENKMTTNLKIAAHVVCSFTEQDALEAAHAEQHPQQQQ